MSAIKFAYVYPEMRLEILNKIASNQLRKQLMRLPNAPNFADFLDCDSQGCPDLKSRAAGENLREYMVNVSGGSVTKDAPNSYHAFLGDMLDPVSGQNAWFTTLGEACAQVLIWNGSFPRIRPHVTLYDVYQNKPVI